MNKIKGGIIVKNVLQDTPFVTLDGVSRKLHADDLMICDHQNLYVLQEFFRVKILESVRILQVYFESAYFDPKYKKVSQRHGLNTDASFRFERGIDPDQSKALSYAAKLVVELAGGTIEGKPYDITRTSQGIQIYVKL